MNNWGAVSGEIGDAQMWSINRAFLDQQMIQGKNFIFTSNPSVAPIGSYAAQEYNYLLSNGYSIYPGSGGLFHATK
jgi:filamentous hemagglutinin